MADKGKFLSLENLARQSFLYNTLAIILCAYFTASFVSRAIAPFLPEVKEKPHVTVKSRPELSQFDSIYARNLFNEKGLIPEIEPAKLGGGTPVKSSLPLELMGVIVVRDSLKSVASVEDKGSNQVLAVRVNDPLTPNTVVQKIEMNKVIFFNKSTGRPEYIDLPEAMGPALNTRSSKTPTRGTGIQQTSPNHFSIDRKIVDKTLDNLPVALTQARCVPNFEGGRPAGYRCGEIEPGSIYDQIGMKEGDVICGINGQALNDPAKAFEVFSQLKTSNSIEVCIKRNGSTSNVTYDIN